MHLLIIEDNRDVADTLQMGLTESGYRVDLAYDGHEGEALALTNDYDLLVVDWMLPGQDGLALVRRIRQAGLHVPALVLTARAEKRDQIEALDAGADDYLSKPFSFEVLLARLRALRRRAELETEPATSSVLEAGALHIDVRERSAHVDGCTVNLRTKEHALLTALARESGRLLTRTYLAEHVWGDLFVSDDVLNTTMASLRRKLHAAGADSHRSPRIETVRGVGYRLAVPETSRKAAA